MILNRAPTLVRVTGTLLLLALLVPSALAGAQQLKIQVAAMSPAYAGQTIQITATVQLGNGTAVGSKASFAGSKLFYPNGTAITLATPTVVAGQLVRWSYPLPANAPDGLYSVTIRATLSPYNATWGLGSFTVNSQVASKSGLTSVMAQLTSMSTQIGSLSTGLAALSSDMKGNFSAVLSELSTEFGTLTSSLNSISTSQANMQTSLKANFTTVLGAISNDYGLTSSAISTGFSGVHTSIGGLSADMNGNFSLLTGALNALKTEVGGLANSASISALNDSMSSGLAAVRTGLGQLASSSQAGDLKSSIQSLANQAALISNIQDFLLLPVVIAVLIIIAFVFLRKQKQ